MDIKGFKQKILPLFTIIFFSALFSCKEEFEEKRDFYIKPTVLISFEIYGKDTVNRVDNNGKQGMWIPTLINKLKDTVYFYNDKIIQK